MSVLGDEPGSPARVRAGGEKLREVEAYLSFMVFWRTNMMTRLSRFWMVVALAVFSLLLLFGNNGKDNESGPNKDNPLSAAFRVVTSSASAAPAPKNIEDPMISAMKFVKAPKGTFWMGWDSQNHPTKQVTIEQDFEIAAYTVTQEQWQAVMGSNPSYFSRKGGAKDVVKDIADADLKRFPVEEVSWDDVQAFLKKLNELQEGKGWLYRVPTEAEWEYACRNAATSKEECSFDFYVDKPTNDLSSKQANFNGDSPGGRAEKGPYLGRPTKVGSYAPNKLGLYDMHGNVYQWCSDLWDADGTKRVVRGASWNLSAWDSRAAERRWCGPVLSDIIHGYVGIRLVRVPSGSN